MSVRGATTVARGQAHRFLFDVSAGTYSIATTFVLLLPLVLLLALAFYLPILELLGRSVFEPTLTTEHYQLILERDIYFTVFIRTMRTALIVSAATLILGYPVAYLMSTLHGWRLTLVAGIVILPLWVSVLVRTYAWTVLLGRNGVVNQIVVGNGLSAEPLKLLNTEFAVLLAMTHILLPMMVLPIYSSLRGIPRGLPLAAQSLGASWPSVLRHVIIPLSLPGVGAGVVLVFIISLGFFITPMLLGGPTSLMIASLITQQATKFLDWPFASALAAVLLLITVAIVIVFNRFLRLERVLGNG